MKLIRNSIIALSSLSLGAITLMSCQAVPAHAEDLNVENLSSYQSELDPSVRSDDDSLQSQIEAFENGYTDSITIDGITYGREDGLEVETVEIPLDANNASNQRTTTVGRWGKSYATSTERLQLYYDGVAYAAGNLYQGKRIIAVTLTYRVPKKDPVKITAKAKYRNGVWIPGKKTGTVHDSLNPIAEKTKVTVSTVRIDHNLTPRRAR